ncbi:HAD family hydrolase, partial [Mycobacterium tuberculosis]|nr:HAD family hydrolase [Mycobacterium tuberculosis]
GIMLAVAGSGTLAGIVLAFVVGTVGIARPLNRSVGQLSQLAAGDLDVAISGTERRDECGAVARGLAVFRDNALKTRTLESEAEALRRDGATAVLVAIDGRPAGILAIADPVKRTTPDAIKALHAAGIRIVML